MSFPAWVAFTSFWFVFTTSPGPNAVNCLQNGLTYGFRRSLWAVAAILMQASLFLGLAAVGAAAALHSHPDVFYALKLLGAVVLIWLGLRRLKAILAKAPAKVPPKTTAIFWPAFLIAVFNVKGFMGYLAGLPQFLDSTAPLAPQLLVIVPTALTLTALSYIGWTAIGAYAGQKTRLTAASRTINLLSATLLLAFGITLLLAL